ncbi:MAG: Ni/Fe-hydrogenase cytochrome b subunit [candidate division Zixibacteria bacterium HGW-Zixibacteria-1]|nr:MAG: Ni/Fe-hydrogenase cytochrome b subunit [candidate division Zixibacteria bacterium HGW-Zixibacteria-1]
MSTHETRAPMKTRFFTKGTTILAAIAGLGILSYVYRLIFGLGAATNLDDQYPWGIWIAIDVASGVALAAGGFTTAALADIFHKDKYHAITRPALLTAMLGYTFVVIGLLADLGRYYNVWHPMIPSMWQGNSVLFEVGLCVMCYLTILYIEFLPIVAERFMGRVALPGPLRVFSKLIDSWLTVCYKYLTRFISLFIIAGVVLSCLHQSSLGTLMIIAPDKVHPLWYTSVSPLMFLLSAIAVGFPMVIFESILSSRSFKLKPELGILSSIARYTPILLGVYLAVKVADLTIRDAWPYLFEGSVQSAMFLIEIIGGVVIPILMLSTPKIRKSVKGLFISATLVIVLGVALNRINVFLVGYTPLYADGIYFPSVFEILVTAGLIALLVLVYRFLVLNLPIISVPNGENVPVGPESSKLVLNLNRDKVK